MKKILLSVLIICCLLAALIAPWITENFAKDRAISSFHSEWKNVSDGCGISCKDCGVEATEKILFGRKVTIKYSCGLLPLDSPVYYQKKQLFVSFIGTVH